LFVNFNMGFAKSNLRLCEFNSTVAQDPKANKWNVFNFRKYFSSNND